MAKAGKKSKPSKAKKEAKPAVAEQPIVMKVLRGAPPPTFEVRVEDRRLLDRALAAQTWGPPPLSQTTSPMTAKKKTVRVQPQSEKARRALLGLYIAADRIPKPTEMSAKVLAGRVKEWLKVETHKTGKSNVPFPSDDVVGHVRKELLKL